MSETEEDRMEVMLPFPEVYIKEEPQEADIRSEADLEEDYEGRMGLEDDYVEGSDVGNNYEEMADKECAELQDHDEFVQLQDIERLKEEDGEICSLLTASDLLQEGTTCGLCQRQYSSASSLKAHLSKKHRLAMGPCFTCHVCGAIGQTKATLKRHLLRTHGQSSLTEHQMLKKCQYCGEGHLNLLALNAHIAEAHSEVLAEYQQCPHCPALFRGRQSMLRHVSRRHPGADPPVLDHERCQECPMAFPSRTALRLHLKSCHPETLVHRCQSCSATFKYSSMLRRHVKNIHEKQQQPKVQQRFKCCKCPREYRSKNYLEKHIALAHLAPKKPRVYPCALCSATFSTRSLRSRHTRTVHRDKSRLRCSECHECFDTAEELEIHRQKHKMKCGVCDKMFLRRDSLREHLLIHSGPKLPCPYCPKKFTQNSNLKRHIRVHTGEKPYKCSFCTKRFGDKSACNSHMRVHTGAERCSCSECGASFSKRQKLNYHMRIHTGEGLLHCPLCNRAATNSYSLKKHLETHQMVLSRLLQGTEVLGQAEDHQRLAIRTLHNLSWVTARASDQGTSLHAPKITSPKVEDKVDGYEKETHQALSSDYKEEKTDFEGNEVVRTAVEHIEVTVKIETPDELDKPVDSVPENEVRNLRQCRLVTRKYKNSADSLEDEGFQNNEMTQQYNDVKTEVLSSIMNQRCTQFNEAVEKCKLEAASKEGKEPFHDQIGNNSWKNNEGKTDEVEGAQEPIKSDLNKIISNIKEEIDIKIPLDNNTLNVAWEQMKECSYTFMEEPVVVFARLWQLIIEPKEGQHCEQITQLSRCRLKEQNFQVKADKDTSEPAQLEATARNKEASDEDNEDSECEDRQS